MQLKPRTKCHKFAADLVTFTEEIVNVKLHFLCSVTANVSQVSESPAENLNLLEEVIRNDDLQQQKSNIHRHKPSTKITSGLYFTYEFISWFMMMSITFLLLQINISANLFQ